MDPTVGPGRYLQKKMDFRDLWLCSNSETKRDIGMDPTDGPELSPRKRTVSRKQIFFAGWVQRESCSPGCTGEVICPLKEIVILKQK